MTRKPRRRIRKRHRHLLFEHLEHRELLAADWQNPVVSWDVNRDERITPFDALSGINKLNRDGPGEFISPHGQNDSFYDSNGDGFHTPLDVLNVVNALNARVSVPVRLTEESELAQQQSIIIGLGQETGSRTYRFEVNATFDNSDTSSALEDIFITYLVDKNDSGTTLLGRDINGTSIFALAGDQADFIPGLVRFDGRVVEIDLTSVGDMEAARLVFQLINSDSDAGTEVTVRPFANDADPDGFRAPTFSMPQAYADAGSPLDFNALTMTSDVAAVVSNVRYDAVSGEYRADLQVRNNGDSTGRAIAVEFTGLPADVSLRNSTGDSPNGNPYLSFRDAIPFGGLDHGAISDAIPVVLDVTDQTPFSWSLDVWTGGPNQAPVFGPVAPITIMPGDSVDVALSATDTDGDPVTFSLTPADDMPTMTFNGNGSIRLTPTPSDIGSYCFDVHATDGHLTVTQIVDVIVQDDPINTTRISGIVLDTDGTPLEGVPIEVGRFQTVTATDGTFELELPSFTVPTEEFDVPVPLGDPHFDPFSEGDKTIALGTMSPQELRSSIHADIPTSSAHSSMAVSCTVPTLVVPPHFV